jgi:hypothetical protein
MEDFSQLCGGPGNNDSVEPEKKAPQSTNDGAAKQGGRHSHLRLQYSCGRYLQWSGALMVTSVASKRIGCIEVVSQSIIKRMEPVPQWRDSRLIDNGSTWETRLLRGSGRYRAVLLLTGTGASTLC